MTQLSAPRLRKLRVPTTLANIRIARQRERDHNREPQMRDCVRMVHKLRNIWQALRVAEDLPAHARTRQRRAIFRDFVAIFQAQQRSTVLRRALKVVQKYRTSQPEAVATLRRDFRATLAYFTIQDHHPTWPRSSLRTTSHLERFNRTLRRRIRSTNAYHSDAGVLAMIAQVVDESVPLPSERKQRTHFQPKAIH